ncbi:hypothetical protein [Halosimplex halobium]|uniref:hypothetical protein n=1 Tax=Halosimplex halobium TaxID=3396618 RepID=UPI003F55FE0B
MVFENLTLFEVHLDDAQFGTDAGRSDERDADVALPEPDSDDDRETADSSGGRGRFVKLAVASVVVSVAATLVARRVAGGDDSVAVGLETDRGVDESATGEPDHADEPVSTPTPDDE